MTTAYHVSPTAALDLDALSATARALDAASGADTDDYLLILGDDYTSGPNAVTLAAWLAPQTTRLRIVPEVPVTHTEPFHVATSTATLDYAASGRAGWSPVAQTSDAAADAVGRRPAASVDAAWGEVPDVVAAVRALWTSWEPDAEIRDEVTHRFIDRDKVHYVDVTGTDSVGQPWSVKGPSIVPRPPQGELPTVTILGDPPRHHRHRTPHRAEHVTPPDGGVRTARLADGTELRADAVLLAQGHLDVDPGDPGTVGEGHIPPGYTVDQDFSAIPAGEGVLVRGFGLAFIDLMEILTEGRGGRFERGAGDAVPTYVPSGREPVLWVGSRRGVSYRSKPVDGPPAVELHHLVPATLDGIPRTPDGHLEPGHLRRLLTAELHGQWSAVTDEPLDLRRIDRPLDGLAFPDRHAVEREVEAVVLTNLGRATDRRHPQDGLLYSTLVASYFVLHSLLAEGLLDDADRDLVAQVEGSFSYVCSGPPPERLGNLLALHRAGVVRFLGPDTWFRRNPGAGPRFLADSPVVVGDPATADHLVDARLAQVTVPRVTDPVLRGLLADGELVAGTGASGAAESVFVVDGDNRAVGADGVARDGLFLVGPSTSDPVREGFGRPGQRTRVFPANRRVAEAVADALVGEQERLSPASR